VSERPVVLLVDDEPRILAALRRVLRREGLELLTAAGAREALDVLARRAAEGRPVALVISDQKMPGQSGLELLEEVAHRHPATARIVLTGWPEDIGDAERARLGIRALLPKPWDDAELKSEIRASLGA
jgi:response regulator RpfG family c-di-GMP phosphodiesterase